MDLIQLKKILEAAILAFGEPITLNQLMQVFEPDARPKKQELLAALNALAEDYQQKGIELTQVASGYCFQTKLELLPWIKRLWPEKPPRYSRALMETLAIIAYRQPVTRGDIEAIRGVTVNSTIIKTLLEHEWIEIAGQREVPGKPSLFVTSKKFLDRFNLRSLTELPVTEAPKEEVLESG